jgi:hypothetical protein
VDEDDFLIVIRPSDLATLRIVTINLEMDGAKIRRSTPGETAAVIIFLPPQHFREHPQSAVDDVLDLAISECGASLWCDPARREAGVSHHHRPGHGVLPGLGRAGDGAVGAGFGDARLAAKSRTRTSGSWAMHGSARARLARKVRFATINMSQNSRNKLLVTGCERSVQGRYRNSAVNGG